MPRIRNAASTESFFLQTFKSTYYPRHDAPALVYAQAFIRPWAGCMLPVMILTLVGVLEGYPVLSFFLVGAGTAMIAASLWTYYQLQRTPAALHVGADTATIETVWDVMYGRRPAGEPVYDLREYPDRMDVTIGYVHYTIYFSRWPRHEELLNALQQARRASQQRLIQEQTPH